MQHTNVLTRMCYKHAIQQQVPKSDLPAKFQISIYA